MDQYIVEVMAAAIVALFGAYTVAMNARMGRCEKENEVLRAEKEASERANDELEQENKEYLALIVTLQAGDPAALGKMKGIVANILRGQKGFGS